MLKTPGGALVPADDAEAEKTRRWPVGSVVRGDFAVMRNGVLFRKWWTLARLAFDAFEEHAPPQKHNGGPVRHSFDAFRRDLTILAGYYEATYGLDGSVKLEAKSLQWSKMKPEEFERLYSATIDVVLAKVLGMGRYTEAELRATVERVLQYA